MKRCPTCNQTYTDDGLSFCLNDGAPLVDASGTGSSGFGGSGSGIKPPQFGGPPSSAGHDPAPTIAYSPHASQAPPTPSWSPMPPPQAPKRKIWPWVLGGVVVIGFLGIGLIVLIIALASMGSNSNSNNRNTYNANYNSNNSNANRNSNSNMGNMNHSNMNTAPNTSGIYVKDIYMAKDDGSGDAGTSVASFSASDRTIHCVVTLNKAQSGTKVKYNWYIENAGGATNQFIKDIDYTTNAFENKVDGHLTLPRDWPTGSYRVDVYINGSFSKSITYSVY